MAPMVVNDKTVPGIVLQNVVSYPSVFKIMAQFWCDIFITGLKFGHQSEGFYILFRSATVRNQFLFKTFDEFQKIEVKVEPVDYDSEDSCIVPYIDHSFYLVDNSLFRNEADILNWIQHIKSETEFCEAYKAQLYLDKCIESSVRSDICYQHIDKLRYMNILSCKVSAERRLLLHEMTEDCIRACPHQNTKILLVELLLSSPVRSDYQKVTRVLEASRIMREMVWSRSLPPIVLILHSLHLASQCYEIQKFSEVESHLNSIEGLVSDELSDNIIRKIRTLLSSAGGALKSEERDGIKTFSVMCDEEKDFSQFILGDIIEVIRPSSMIIQPFCREECRVNFDTSDVFNASGQKLTSFPQEDPAKFLLKINFMEKQIFLCERNMLDMERTEDETTDDIEDEEPIFLSESGGQLPVDIDDEIDEDKLFKDLKAYISDRTRNSLSNKQRRSLLKEFWRNSSILVLSLLKSKTVYSSQEIRGYIRNNSNINCKSGNRKKIFNLASDFLIVRLKESLQVKGRENNPLRSDKIVDVDDDEEDNEEKEEKEEKENEEKGWEEKKEKKEKEEESEENEREKKEKKENEKDDGDDNKVSRLENDLSKKNDMITKILEENESLKRDLTDFIDETCSMESSLREELTEKDNDLRDKDAIIESFEKMIKDKDDEIYCLKIQLYPDNIYDDEGLKDILKLRRRGNRVKPRVFSNNPRPE